MGNSWEFIGTGEKTLKVELMIQDAMMGIQGYPTPKMKPFGPANCKAIFFGVNLEKSCQPEWVVNPEN